MEWNDDLNKREEGFPPAVKEIKMRFYQLG